jgi:glycosyltransferase involved in cell wall biosynthesis
MEIKIDIEQLRKRGIFLATPMYGGQCAGMFTKSVADLSAFCANHNIPLQMYFLFNESLITRARNYCVDEFMRSQMQHLMFIDSDIGFSPQDVIALMALQTQNEEYDIIGGPYPKKTIAWEKIKYAVDKGVADEDPSVLDRYVGDFVFNPKSGSGSIRIDEPVEVLEIGTGFMMITRKALEKFTESYKEMMYRPDHVRTEAFDGTREIMQFFQAEIDPVSKRYLSEDYWFCQKSQAIGLKTWFCPWMRLQHVGTYIFGGSLADLASIGASATADPSQLKKKK